MFLIVGRSPVQSGPLQREKNLKAILLVPVAQRVLRGIQPRFFGNFPHCSELQRLIHHILAAGHRLPETGAVRARSSSNTSSAGVCITTSTDTGIL